MLDEQTKNFVMYAIQQHGGGSSSTDADTLDGHHSSYFATAAHTHDADNISGLVRLWVQAAEPTGAKTPDVWIDTDDPSRYDRLEITATGTHTISATSAEFLECTGSSAITLTITATAAITGTLLMIKNSSTAIVTLVATINGGATNVLYPGEMVRLIWNGTDWRS